ncbi:hypothetical protein A359_04660 [secondary endosymbiont of Ctenarytaina eucalypti]|uniref:Uncharacterized protein n=1 Tax=secondary endosymbiont of Ctenarytaina eucalypti TaxID=1199245 RepID=J3Z3S6_9ENTR|nr:hypothetical protein A359_04660 [secondary endosymbiont of Ctenarytaina eucalypti]
MLFCYCLIGNIKTQHAALSPFHTLIILDLKASSEIGIEGIIKIMSINAKREGVSSICKRRAQKMNIYTDLYQKNNFIILLFFNFNKLFF